MRVAYILNTLQTGGAERQVLALAERINSRGHVVKLLVLRKAGATHLHTRLDVLHLNMHHDPISAAAGFARAMHAIRKFRPHVLHSNQFHGNMLGRLLHLLLPSVPAISTIHNVYEGGPTRMFAYRVSEFLSVGNIAVCSAAAERFATEHATSRRNTHVITNGIDVKMFAPNTSSHAHLREEMAAGKSFVWLAACRLTPAKDVSNLLRAFVIVRKQHSGAQLWIAGEGRPSHVHTLKRLSDALGNHSTVRWLGLRNDIAALLDGADAFVLSSAWEGLPLALGEAMAMAKPFVSTDVGGVRDLAGDCGILVAPGDPVALAKAMLTTMQMSATDRCAVGKAARVRVETHFDLDAKVLEWERYYQENARL